MEFDRSSQVYDNYFEYRTLCHPTKRWSAFARRAAMLPVKYNIFPEAISSNGVISFVSASWQAWLPSMFRTAAANQSPLCSGVIR